MVIQSQCRGSVRSRSRATLSSKYGLPHANRAASVSIWTHVSRDEAHKQQLRRVQLGETVSPALPATCSRRLFAQLQPRPADAPDRRVAAQRCGCNLQERHHAAAAMKQPIWQVATKLLQPAGCAAVMRWQLPSCLCCPAWCCTGERNRVARPTALTKHRRSCTAREERHGSAMSARDGRTVATMVM